MPSRAHPPGMFRHADVVVDFTPDSGSIPHGGMNRADDPPMLYLQGVHAA